MKEIWLRSANIWSHEYSWPTANGRAAEMEAGPQGPRLIHVLVPPPTIKPIDLYRARLSKQSCRPPHARTRAHKHALTSREPDCSASFCQIVDHLGAVNGSIKQWYCGRHYNRWGGKHTTWREGVSAKLHTFMFAWYKERRPPTLVNPSHTGLDNSAQAMDIIMLSSNLDLYSLIISRVVPWLAWILRNGHRLRIGLVQLFTNS